MQATVTATTTATTTSNAVAVAGRKLSGVWDFLNDDADVHLQKRVVCKWCHGFVNSHKKVAIAKVHLIKCTAFYRFVQACAPTDRPGPWYTRPILSLHNSRDGTGDDSPVSTVAKTTKAATAKAATATATTTTQRSMHQYIRPTTTTTTNVSRRLEENETFQRRYAFHVFQTGSAWDHIECPDLLAAMQGVLRPGVTLPSRFTLAGTLLDSCYEEVVGDVQKRLGKGMVCLIIAAENGRSTTTTKQNESVVIHYTAASPTETVFLESVPTTTTADVHGGHSTTAAWWVSEIVRVWEGHSSYAHFAGAVIADNTTTTTTCAAAAAAAANHHQHHHTVWAALKRKFPTCFFHGCASHGLHLLVNDIFAATAETDCDDGITRPSYSDDHDNNHFPLAHLVTLVANANLVVDFFLRHPVVKAKLVAHQKELGVPGLTKRSPTRCGSSIQPMCVSLLQSERPLYHITSDPDFLASAASAREREERQNIQSIVCDDSFVELLQKAIAILVPIDRLIARFQSDSVALSQVYEEFHALPETYAGMVNAFLNESELDYIQQVIRKRLFCILSDGHFIANHLDPRFLGESLTPALLDEAKQLIWNTPPSDSQPATNETRRTELSDFCQSMEAKKEAFGFEYQMLMEQQITVLQYWEQNGKTWPNLSKIARKAFSMATSSASSTLKFSTFGFLHRKLRQRLEPEAVRKLVFIKTNRKVIPRSELAAVIAGERDIMFDDDVDDL